MRVLMLNNEFPPLGGGTGTVNRAVLQRLAQVPGLEVDLLTSALGRRPEVEQFAERVRLLKVPVQNRNLHHSSNRELLTYAARALPVALRLHRERPYALVFAWSAVPAGVVALALRQIAGLPYILRVCGPDIPGFERRYGPLYPILTPPIKAAWRGASRLVAKCQGEAAMMTAVLPGLRVELVPNGVDLAAFPAAPIAAGGPLRVICVARLIERKGQHHLLAAVRRLVDAGVDLQLDLVGEGDALEANQRQAAALGITDRVTFAGYVPREQIAARYAAAHVFVLPSYNEGMSVATLEAMAAGLPTIVTRTGGTAELVEDNVTGRTFAWADIDALVTHLCQLAADRDLARRMGAAARARARRFTWDAAAQRYLAMFDELAPHCGAALARHNTVAYGPPRSRRSVTIPRGSHCDAHDTVDAWHHVRTLQRAQHMCGICGILHANHSRYVDPDLLRALNDRITHRGPDSDGYFTQGSLGMAMRRLAIIDLSGGSQPIFNEDGSVAIVFNGEIYNFRSLRAELEAAGHHFATGSDTEVIVHGYEQWGDGVLTRLNGMFAFSLWDARRRRLLIARDRMGEKPLYWHHCAEHGLVWGSEAKAVLAAPWVERRVDPVALHHYLTLQYTPDPLTIYAGISQLPAAHKLVIEDGMPPRVERWWQLSFEPKEQLSDAEAIERARSLLTAAVERQMVAEVPLGAFLSGGIDSSIIVALMAERAGTPIRTFSIGFDERHFSETHYARQVAERYATEHHEFVFRPADLVGAIEGVAAAADEPFADPAALPLFELARQTRRHVTVALSGDGGDETLAGYRRYLLDGWLRPYSALPRWVTQGAVPAVVSRVPELYGIPEDRNPVTGLKRLGQFSAVTHKASLVRWGSYFSHGEKLALYGDRWRDALAGVDTANWIAGAYDGALAASLLDRTLAAEHATYLAGDLLPKTDRVTMAHSLEARAPFLDAEWVEWTACLPSRFKVRGQRTKWLLTAAFGDKLPPRVAARGKQGFSVPVGAWLRGELRGWARERLVGNPALDEWFRPEAVAALFDEHAAGKLNHGKKLWSLLMFGVWAEQRVGVLA